MRDQLSELLSPLVSALSYELWELEYVRRGGNTVLRLYIDSPAGISLDDCERVSRAVSERLDSIDPIPGQYTLEVSSPGLDRVLRTAQHFARVAGERVRVEMTHAIGGRKRFQGQLLEATDREITLNIDGGRVTLPIDEIHKARVAPQM